MTKPKPKPAVPQMSRIKQRNLALIMDSALEIFSSFGFRGSTIDQIADLAGMTKPHLLYYYNHKEDIYRAVLERTLSQWLTPLESLDAEGDPIEELTRYISRKLDLSYDQPKSSRFFANEILHGAPNITDFLKGPLRELVEAKAAVIQQWCNSGKINPVNPAHLIFAIWSITQHYADFNVQVQALLSGGLTASANREVTRKAVLEILLRGLKPAP